VLEKAGGWPWRGGGTGFANAWIVAVSDLELHPASVSTGQQKKERNYIVRDAFDGTK
jgi:hypothetical protein